MRALTEVVGWLARVSEAVKVVVVVFGPHSVTTPVRTEAPHSEPKPTLLDLPQ